MSNFIFIIKSIFCNLYLFYNFKILYLLTVWFFEYYSWLQMWFYYIIIFFDRTDIKKLFVCFESVRKTLFSKIIFWYINATLIKYIICKICKYLFFLSSLETFYFLILKKIVVWFSLGNFLNLFHIFYDKNHNIF